MTTTLTVIHANLPAAKAKVWAQGYTREEIEAAQAELEDRNYIGPCFKHTDCVVLVSEGQSS